MARYIVQAMRITRIEGAWDSSEQLPSFILDSSIQGIVNVGHAEKIARDILPDSATVFYKMHVEKI